MVRPTPVIELAGRPVGPGHPPLVIPEIGINHVGDLGKARRMVHDAAQAGAEIVKFQTHIPAAEMIPNDVVPGNETRSIWDIISEAVLSGDDEQKLKAEAEELGLAFLSTPFSREAADRLEALGVTAFKIGSGECSNLPLIDHIASFGKPMVVSTGMHGIEQLGPTVEVLRSHRVPFALLHCTSVYPTPPSLVRLGALAELREAFPDAVVGLSDHTLNNHTCLAAVALGASIVERHFTSDRAWPGPDIEVSMDPVDLADLVVGATEIHQALGGHKSVLAEEQVTIDFAFASVVTIAPIPAGAPFDGSNTWVKRPGDGEIPATRLPDVLGSVASRSLPANHQVTWSDVR
ncbi:N-acetylneuraminate synthase family protein [Aquihabitans sp. McL0605]|uniref:N-acetylneuraminate synthase family protein n=1 Tax=Aquihabitans sp. McL0605 TaxID=3415671 RepID=UPI003CF1FB66